MCNTSLSCCSDKIAVQDKVCTNWQLTAIGTQIIYSDNISSNINGTGYIKFDTGTGTVTANFSRSGVTIQTIVIPAGSSVSFSVARFDTISLTSTAVDALGEFCITVRYNL